MDSQKTNTWLPLIVGLIVIAAGGYLLWQYLNPSTAVPAVGTNTDVFVATSTPADNGISAILDTAIGQGITGVGITVIPLELVEDSRCATDVVCIQAGTVRVRVKIQSDAGEQESILTLGTPFPIQGAVVILTSVLPAPNSKVQIKPSDYRFTFKVTRLIGSYDEKG